MLNHGDPSRKKHALWMTLYNNELVKNEIYPLPGELPIKKMRFEGKDGTDEESNFLSDKAYRVVRFVLDALNFLISFATFGKKDKFFTKTPSVEEQKLITEKRDALMATHAALKAKLDALSEPKDDERPGF